MGVLVETGRTILTRRPGGILSLDSDHHLIPLGEVDAADRTHLGGVGLEHDLVDAGQVAHVQRGVGRGRVCLRGVGGLRVRAECKLRH